MTPVLEPVRGIAYFPTVVGEELCRRIKTSLMDESLHSGADIVVEGARHRTPRLVSSFSDRVLTLDGMQDSRVWTSELAELRDRVSTNFSLDFNYALANLYRDGDDYTGWHSDKAALHVEGSKIAIVSFGASRRLSVRSCEDPGDAQNLLMEEGSVVVMDLDVQATHEHSVLKEVGLIGPRMSITLRNIHIMDEYISRPAM